MIESQWNKEIALECFRCLRDFDLDRMLMYLHSGVELGIPGKRFGGTYSGATEVREFFVRFFEEFGKVRGSGVTSRTDVILAEGHAVFASTVQEGTLRNGKRLNTRMSWLFKFDGRKIQSMDLSYDTEKFEELMSGGAAQGGEAAA
jgi:ketosteroid isomerase-like protein